MHPLTLELARRIDASSWPAVNEAVGDEAVRGIVNWFGAALNGTRDGCEAVAASAWRAGFDATTLGRGGRLDAADVAAITAAGADALCWVDTQLPTTLSPSPVVGAALLPLAEHRGAPGAAFVHAYLLGIEVACRAAAALGLEPEPDHARPRLACSALGAAAGCARLAGLDAARTRCALETAWSQCAATDDAVDGAMHAARIGLHAALGTAAHLTPAAATPLVPPAAEAMLDAWGSDWHCTRLAYHAHPCALDLHAVVEACLQLKHTHHITGRQIAAVAIGLPPSLIARNRGAAPADGHAARHSVEHAAAVALLDGEAGLAQFEPPRLRSGRVRDLRAKVTLFPEPALAQTAARVSLTLASGETVDRQVRCALGHPLRPLSDHDLSGKFSRLAADVLATDQSERLLGLVWNIRALPDMAALVRTSVPEDVVEASDLPGSPLIPR